MQIQNMELPSVRNGATKALKADSATAAFCSRYMLTAADSLGVLQIWQHLLTHSSTFRPWQVYICIQETKERRINVMV